MKRRCLQCKEIHSALTDGLCDDCNRDGLRLPDSMTPDPKATPATPATDKDINWHKVVLQPNSQRIVDSLIARIDQQREKIATLEQDNAKLREERDALATAAEDVLRERRLHGDIPDGAMALRKALGQAGLEAAIGER